MPTVLDLPEIPARFISLDYLDSTIRMFTGRSRMGFDDCMELIRDHGYSSRDVRKIYHLENPSEIFIQFSCPDMAVEICGRFSELRDAYKSYPITVLNRDRFALRLHWVPAYVKQEYIQDLCGRFGTVGDMKRDHAKSNIWIVNLQVTMEQKRNIPHLCRLPSGEKFLLTFPGRSPLCLACGEVGHMRKKCPHAKTENRPRLFSDVVTQGPGQTRQMEERNREERLREEKRREEDDRRVEDARREEERREENERREVEEGEEEGGEEENRHEEESEQMDAVTTQGADGGEPLVLVSPVVPDSYPQPGQEDPSAPKAPPREKSRDKSIKRALTISSDEITVQAKKVDNKIGPPDSPGPHEEATIAMSVYSMLDDDIS